MSILDSLRRNGSSPDESRLREELRAAGWQMDLMQENMRTLEASLEDGQWRKLGAQLEREFTREGLDTLVDLSRGMYLSHPLIQRAVNVTTYYTWGQGVEFSSEIDGVMDNLVNPMVRELHNKAELFGHQARLLTDVDQLVDGNTFTVLFPQVDPTQVGSIPTEEVRRIHRNPDDRREVWYYRRRWDAVIMDESTGTERTETREELHPDVGYLPAVGSRPDQIGGVTVRWDAPVLHQKVGGLKQMRFGIPATYAAIDWARAYRKFLEDWHTIVSSLARFAWKATTKGSKVAATKRKMSSGISQELAEENNPSPPAGSVFVGTDADSFEPIPKTGAHTSAEDARPSRLMVGAAMDLPDTILSGDADVGNLATAKSLDRPTELAMRSRQSMYSDWYSTLFASAAVWRREGFSSTPTPPADGSELVQVKFPPILEHDPLATVQALVTAATLDGKLEAGTIPRDDLAKALMSAVGIEDVAEALDRLKTEDRQQVEQAVERLREALQ